MKKGDKVKILRRDIFNFSHRKNRNGRITNIDGALIDVKPMWCNWVIELYPTEIRVIK